jgi:hypothetical protein
MQNVLAKINSKQLFHYGCHGDKCFDIGIVGIFGMTSRARSLETRPLSFKNTSCVKNFFQCKKKNGELEFFIFSFSPFFFSLSD